MLCAFGGKQHGGYENNVTFGCLFHSWCLDPSEVGHADSCTQTQLPMILKTPQESIEKVIKQQQQQKKPHKIKIFITREICDIGRMAID